MSVDVIGLGRYYIIVFVSLTLKHDKKKEARKKKAYKVLKCVFVLLWAKWATQAVNL